MKKVQKQLKKLLCITLMLSMIAGSLSGCGIFEKNTADVVIQNSASEVREITLNSKGQDGLLLSAGEKLQLQLDTTAGTIADIAVTPNDAALVPYKYYTVTVTIAAKNNESFVKDTTVTLDGVELKVREWTADKLVVEYTTLALPETITTDAMSKVTSYKNAENANIIGTAKIQALLDHDLTIFSEDGNDSYTIETEFVPLFMIPSFVSNGALEKLKNNTSVQIISEHGEKDFSGACGNWYKIAVNGKIGYIPASFVKDIKITESEQMSDTAFFPNTTDMAAQTKPAVKPVINQNNPSNTVGNDNESGNHKDTDSTNNKEEKFDDNSGNNTENNAGSNNGNNGGNSNGNGSDSDSDNGIHEVTYYNVSFALGDGISSNDAFLPKDIMVRSDSIITLNQLATPSVPGYLFDSWFYDSALTKQVQNGDKINGNITLYAKLLEISEEEHYVGEDNYVSSVDVDAANFTIAVLSLANTRSTEAITDIVRLLDISNPDTSLSVQISAAGTISLEGIVYNKYLLSSDELDDGTTYQMELLSDSYVFYYEDQLQPAAVRLYNFTTKMAETENLVLNSDLIYLKKEDISYTEGSDYLSGLFSVTVEEDDTQLNTVEGSGSFIYNGSQSIGVGSTVAIYDGAEVPKLGENGLSSAEQYDGTVAYLTVSKIEGNTFYYSVAEAESVLFIPDVLPINTADDEDGSNNNTVTIDTEKLLFSGSDYEEMGLDQDTSVDVGDYIAFYNGSLETAAELTYGRITAISVSGEDTILTYETVDEAEVLEAMTVYSTEAVEFELDEDTAKAIEEEMEKDAIDSGFAMEAANYLATVALATEEVQLRAKNNNVKVEGLKVKANVNRKLEHLANSGAKNGVRAQLEVSFTVKIGSGDNMLELKVSATFEQEVLLNLNIKGKSVWGKKWIFPYIKDYRINTNLDVGTFTGVGITATIITTEGDAEYDWETVDKSLSEQIHELMDQQDKFFNQDIASNGGGLAEKYAAMMENNSEWIDLVEVKIFSTEAKILAGIIVVGVQADFVVSAKVNIMLGMSFEYSVAKRYSFTLNVLSKTSSSNAVDLQKSNYNFDLYVMGTIGVRAGVRLTVYAGLFSKKVAAIGVTAEAGAYVQLWGYFYYSSSWKAGSDKTSSVSGAMLMEIGAYLEIRFLATAFGGTFEYNPILYDKYWPLWNVGSVENVYGFNYETTVGEADDKDINMGTAESVALPVDRLNMSYMNLRNGETNNRTYTYSDFTITTTGNFIYENGVIKVNPQDGSAEEKGTIKLTWNGAELSFTSQPLSCEMDLTWSDPSRKHTVSYELHGGNVMENGNILPNDTLNSEVITGGKLNAPVAEITKEHYTFDGWYKDSAYTELWNFATDKVTSNLILHAKWTPISYDISYELSGGANHTSNPTSYTIETAVILQDPVRTGYRFGGWNTAEDGTGTSITELPVGSYGTKVLYAQWIALEQTYEIHHMLENPDGSGYEDIEMVPAIAKTGETVNVGADQSKAYTGFTYDADNTSDSTGTIPEEGTLILKLYYRRNRYDVTFESGITQPVVTEVVYQSKIEKPVDPIREGYDFTGWFVITDSSQLWDFENDTVTEKILLHAGWTAKEYNVTFDMQAGSGGDSNVMARYDSPLTDIATPARAGYQFLGYFDADGTQYYNADGSGTRNWDKADLAEGTEYFTLYARWQANNYTVCFDANGGSGTMNDQSFTYDEEKALTSNSFSRTGYTFVGWALADHAANAAYIDMENVKNLTAAADDSVILYAVWTPVTYTITFDGNGAAEGSMEQQSLTYDLLDCLYTNGYSKAGYHFTGWATETNGTVVYEEGAFVSNLANTQGENITLYAVWEANSYQVVFCANGGSGTMENQSFTYDEAAKNLLANGYSKIGYQFIGWATENTAADAAYTDRQNVQNLVSDHQGVLTLYAVWQANSYTVNFDANDGSGTMDNQSFTYDEEQALTTNSFVRTGYHFAGWATESTAVNAVYTDGQKVQNLLSDHHGILTLYAVWEADQYTISFDSNKGTGSSTPTTADEIEVTYGSIYGNLPNVSREGYTFLGWFTSDTGGTQVQAADRVLLTGDQTLYAQWTANTYDVTYHSGEGNFADGTTNLHITQVFDTPYILPDTAPTREGYIFLGWFTSGTNETQITADTNMTTAQTHTLCAVWEAINKVSVSVGGITLDCSENAVYAKTDSITGVVTEGGNEEDYNIKLENGILTLRNANIVYGDAINAVSVKGNLTIILAEGTENTITSNSNKETNSAWNCGIYIEGNLTISGSGTLTATGGTGYTSHGISVAGILVIDGAKVTAIGQDAKGSSGIYSSSYLEIKNNAKVHAQAGATSGGYSLGIECRSTVSITDSNVTTAGSDAAGGNSYGIMGSSISITNSTGSAKGETQAMSKEPTFTNAASSGAYTDFTMTWNKSAE